MEKYLNNSLSFSEYRGLLNRLALEGGTTGAERSESRINYTRLNRQRMARLEKTIVLNNAVRQAAAQNRRRMIWLILTEAWCGDAAQNLPIIEKIAAESDIIETRYILRDENLELMDRFLENGARSIPRLIAMDRDSLEILGSWGPRPAVLKEYYLRLRSQGLEKLEIGELLQRWYNEDKGQSLQKEFETLIHDWDDQVRVLAAA